jgi:hypothetical protein
VNASDIESIHVIIGIFVTVKGHTTYVSNRIGRKEVALVCTQGATPIRRAMVTARAKAVEQSPPSLDFLDRAKFRRVHGMLPSLSSLHARGDRRGASRTPGTRMFEMKTTILTANREIRTPFLWFLPRFDIRTLCFYNWSCRSSNVRNTVNLHLCLGECKK